MAISDETGKAIIERIQERLGGKLARCPLCGHSDWSLSGGFVSLSVQDIPSSALVVGGPVLPMVALACLNCGNTHLMNLLVLGLNDIASGRSHESE